MLSIRKAKDKFKIHLTKSGKSPHTIRSYERHLSELLDFLEGLKKSHVHLITRKDLENFLKKYAQNKKVKSLNSQTVALKSFFKFLEINEYITQNPATALRYLKEKEEAPRILSIVEYRALRDAAREDPRSFAIIELMLQTGIKIGEVSRIRLKDLKQGNLNILDEKQEPSRLIPLNLPAQKALESWLKIRPKVKSDILFVTKNGKAIDPRNIRGLISKYYKKAGIVNARVHDLRHTFCAHHIKKGTSLTTIAYIAGHKNLNTVKKYLGCIEKPEAENFKENAL